MSYTLTGKLVVAISSRALFDFEEENRIFESTDDSAYMKLQLERLATANWSGLSACQKTSRF
jgi:5'-nucleotidase